jgi:hypothetical protein
MLRQTFVPAMTSIQLNPPVRSPAIIGVAHGDFGT